jgi:Arc/MetJ-type ribon-helix-helix transcriptional regulator
LPGAPFAVGGMLLDSHMGMQIAVRLPDEVLEGLDAEVAAGRYPSRAAAVRMAIEALLRAGREREIAEEYRRAYGQQPEEDWVGEAGLAFMAQVLATEAADAGGGRRGRSG